LLGKGLGGGFMGNLFVLSVLFWGSLALGGAQQKSVPLNSSVLLFNEWDLDRCEQQVKKAIGLGNRTINFVPTLGYQFNSSKEATIYCLPRRDGSCHVITNELVELFSSKIKRCVAPLLESSIHVSFVPHLDYASKVQGLPKVENRQHEKAMGEDGVNTAYWRNFLIFDPLKSYNGFTYEEIMLRPLFEASKPHLAKGLRVQLALQGEMGATTFSYPQSYASIIESYRRLANSPLFEIGVSLNHDKINGRIVNQDFKSLQNLFDLSDFVGISAYRRVSVPPLARDFYVNIQYFVNELRRFGVTLSPKTSIHFSEFGIGGGDSSGSGNMAQTLTELATSLWSGIHGNYRVEKDPWQKPEYADFRRKYYFALLEFLKSPPAAHPVTAAYLWNSGSWDVQGLYTEQRHYADAQIVEWVRLQN
jgi:hypothetical protein